MGNEDEELDALKSQVAMLSGAIEGWSPQSAFSRDKELLAPNLWVGLLALAGLSPRFRMAVMCTASSDGVGTLKLGRTAITSILSRAAAPCGEVTAGALSLKLGGSATMELLADAAPRFDVGIGIVQAPGGRRFAAHHSR